jgi:hypothetical protein
VQSVLRPARLGSALDGDPVIVIAVPLGTPSGPFDVAFDALAEPNRRESANQESALGGGIGRCRRPDLFLCLP